ncbi:MAG: hydantoinase B/oxoprolinase family protein [Planctomycetaceae bacterium]
MLNHSAAAKSPAFPVQLWADVGGTFTDCFAVVGAQRRSLKVLSNGVVRGRVLSVDGSRINILLTHASPPGQFWNGARYRLFRGGVCVQSGEVIDQSARDTLVLDREVSGAAEDEWLLELDPQCEAPVLAAHLLLGVPIRRPLPPIDVRLGTTRGTNALLTRSGARVGLVTTKGFGDCLEISEQNRPDLFAICIQKPPPLTSDVLEADERLTAAGEVLRPLDAESLVAPLADWLRSGVTSLAICLLHAHVNDIHEQMIAEVARRVGFKDISISSRVAPLIKLVSRAETTVLDAYLSPVLAGYIARLEQQFNRNPANSFKSRLRLMTSGGNLVDAESFRGGDSILSGPAGGVVALAKIADAYAPHGAIGLDMGGTSTDVCRYAGKIPREYESRKAGIRILSPMMAIHTVAAGGGSICDVVDGRMIVGPHSAGAFPGPACYGRGGPLTVTDLNVILGRLPPDRFPFPLDLEAARRCLREVNAKLGEASFANDEDAAEGFLTIAVTHMAEAVRTVSTAQGSDPRDLTLVGFGGAAGGHLCAVATALGMKRIIDHRDASLLSALGMGLADVGRIRTHGIYCRLDELDESRWSSICDSVTDEAMAALASEGGREGLSRSAARCRIEADLRYQGTEAALIVDARPWDTLGQRFHDAHQAAFGYDQRDREIEVAAVRCEATIPATSALDPAQPPPPATSAAPRLAHVYVDGQRRTIPLWFRNDVLAGDSLEGPAIVLDDNSTLVIDPDWKATKLPNGSFEMQRLAVASLDAPDQVDANTVDAITVEVVARRMQGIADAMGELLRRTAASVNIRQRLDFSCAIFTSRGELIANAPHVPVHLGAMGHTVRAISEAFPGMTQGDVYVSNHPYAGGSHLPDVTVVTPVFCSPKSNTGSGAPDFFLASRAHHAEIGGKTPGSMPPDSTCLGEEGVVIEPFALRRGGIESVGELQRLLTSGAFPPRDAETNLPDIAAQRAAGVLGTQYLQPLVASLGLSRVNACVERLFDHADQLVGRWVQSLPREPLSFSDSLDDDTRIAVTLRHTRDRLLIDFSGTSPVHPGCFNATPAIVTAATIYVLRCIVGGTLPMNDGILRRVELHLPVGLLNPPVGQSSQQSPAVVAGNVETSMRIVDCLMGALGIAAASQGTMNNVLIGDHTFGYYETIGGGAGASPQGAGADGVHTHMTNTRITDPEVYEANYPVRLWRFELRRGSGGAGRFSGGAGLIREIEFLKPLSLSLITNRRGAHRPWGAAGGHDGSPGENILIQADGESVALPAAITRAVQCGDRLIILTPGGGGWGPPIEHPRPPH